MANLNDAEFKDLNEIIHKTVNALIDCADKHNIDRDSFIKYFGGVFGTMAQITTFEHYHQTEKERKMRGNERMVLSIKV